MKKTADFFVSKVKYAESPKKIVSLKVHKYGGESVGKVEVWTRLKILNSLENKVTFQAVYRNENKSMRKGPELKLVTINNSKFIRTDASLIEEDSLEKIPEF